VPTWVSSINTSFFFIIPKEISKSAKSYYNIYTLSKEKGKIIPIKCSRCSEKNLEYYVLSRADCYREYTKSVGCDSCDMFGSSASS
jgi:hypothetical protein